MKAKPVNICYIFYWFDLFSSKKSIRNVWLVDYLYLSSCLIRLKEEK